MADPAPSFVDLPTRMRINTEQWDAREWQFACDLRVALPGVVQSFDPDKQTVKVQLAIQENIFKNLVPTSVDIAPLVDVPVLLPRAGGFTLTMPVQAGDECLVIFGDMCIDSWWQSGKTGNVQLDRRRHDLSDGFALLGCWSQPRKLSDYSTTAAQLRSDSGNTVVEVGENTVTIKAGAINIQGPVNITGDVTVTGNLSSTGTLDGKNFLTHQHTGVATGGGNSGPVL